MMAVASAEADSLSMAHKIVMDATYSTLSSVTAGGMSVDVVVPEWEELLSAAAQTACSPALLELLDERVFVRLLRSNAQVLKAGRIRTIKQLEVAAGKKHVSGLHAAAVRCLCDLARTESVGYEAVRALKSAAGASTVEVSQRPCSMS